MEIKSQSTSKTLFKVFFLVATLLSCALTAPKVEAESGFSSSFSLTNDHIVIPAIVAGQGPYAFLVDTGATANIITSSLAQVLALPMSIPVPVNGFGAVQSLAQRTRPVTIAISGTAQPDQSFILLDSALQIVKTALPIQGVLGLPLLQKLAVFIDFQDNQISAFSPKLRQSVWPAYSGQHSVQLTFTDNGIALMPATINGISGKFQLDTGSNASVILYSQFAQAHPDQFAAPQVPSLSASGNSRQFGGAVQLRSIGRAAVSIGSLNSIASPVLIAGSTPPSSVGKDIAGNIGVALLKQFSVMIDYPDADLTIAPSIRSSFSNSAPPPAQQ